MSTAKEPGSYNIIGTFVDRVNGLVTLLLHDQTSVVVSAAEAEVHKPTDKDTYTVNQDGTVVYSPGHNAPVREDNSTDARW
jgi:hypothetical protein